MASFNKVLLLGNLTRDPQVKHLPSGVTVAEFGLAVNRRFKTQSGEVRDDVAFIDCTAFGRPAETIGQYCTRGKPLLVEGRLKYDSWDDKMGRGKRSKLTVVVESFQFLPGRERSGVPQPGMDSPGEGASSGDADQGFRRDNAHSGGGGSGGARSTSRPRGKPGGVEGPQPVGAGAPAGKPFGDQEHFSGADIPF